MSRYAFIVAIFALAPGCATASREVQAAALPRCALNAAPAGWRQVTAVSGYVVSNALVYAARGVLRPRRAATGVS